MTSRVVVVLYILLCLVVGTLLSFLPWIQQGYLGLGDWGNNYFLVTLVHKTGFYNLQHVLASGWIRGAVTGLGMLNLFLAFWEIAHFQQAVRVAETGVAPRSATLETHGPNAVDLSDNRRVDEKQ